MQLKINRLPQVAVQVVVESSILGISLDQSSGILKLLEWFLDSKAGSHNKEG